MSGWYRIPKKRLKAGLSRACLANQCFITVEMSGEASGSVKNISYGWRAFFGRSGLCGMPQSSSIGIATFVRSRTWSSWKPVTERIATGRPIASPGVEVAGAESDLVEPDLFTFGDVLAGQRHRACVGSNRDSREVLGVRHRDVAFKRDPLAVAAQPKDPRLLGKA